ncbi:MAG: HAD family hydrolase [Lachnospiraceae bacterium]|nr:HAD family hydrolase [Lachnospiraceae bacterium]
MYQVILFDLDGTLTDPGLGITNSVMYALKKWGIEVEDRSELYKFIGPPLQESFERFYGFSEEKAKQSVEYYREYFREKGLFENEVYEGIEDLLKTLHDSGYKLLLATSKPEEFAIRILEHFQLAKYFNFIGGASMDGVRSKKADVISYVLKKAGIEDLSKAAMVGDREHDIIGAKQVGIDSIGVLFGYGNYEELENAGATYIVDSVSKILDIVKKR